MARDLTCLSCRHSLELNGVLWCDHIGRPALAKCWAFEYEPGTDEAERPAPEPKPTRKRSSNHVPTVL